MEDSSLPPAFLRKLPWVAIALVILSLLFRSLIWRSWRPYPGDPYGFADILEFVMGVALLFVCATSVAAGLAFLVVPRWGFRATGVRLLAVGIVVPVVYYFVYPRLPLFQLWS